MRLSLNKKSSTTAICAVMLLIATGCCVRLGNDTAEVEVVDTPIHESDSIQPDFEPVQFPFRLRDFLRMETEWDTVRGIYEPLELTDTLREKIRNLVDGSTACVWYRMVLTASGYLDYFREDMPYYHWGVFMEEGYYFTDDDKDALYNYLCLNTGLYHYISTRCRGMPCNQPI